MHTLNIRVTHHTAGVETLEAFAFPDIKKALLDIHSLRSVKEVVVIQTCNRVEIFAAADDIQLAYHDIIDYLMYDIIQRMKVKQDHMYSHEVEQEELSDRLVKHIVDFSAKLHDAMQIDYHIDALLHLLRLTSGVESMIIGEDQIIGQVRDSFRFSRALNTVGPFFENIFTKTLHVGQVVRYRTNINKGAVSIGSAAVELGSEVLGGLEEKIALLIGVGEMGTLVSRAMAEQKLKKLVVINRTYSKALKISEELGAETLKFENLKEGIKESDLIVTATSSYEPIITKKLLEETFEDREEPLVIIDVAIPRDVSDNVEELKFVKAFNIDGLRAIAEKNRKAREKEIVKVEEIIEEELKLLVKQIYRIDVEDLVSKIFMDAEIIRNREIEKALKMLDNLGERDKKIIDDLTRVIVKRTLTPIASSIRESAESGNQEAIKVAENWFDMGLNGKEY
ncbi:glutamyl-tRNA reductase [archaeon]|nr:glutamyl-tRNA reductase [archaeon]